jgi:hypothetical protein
MMEAVNTFETSVNFYHVIPQDSHIRISRQAELKSHMITNILGEPTVSISSVTVRMWAADRPHCKITSHHNPEYHNIN